MGIKILLADDYTMICEGLCALFKNQPDMEVIGQARDGRKAVELADELQPDLVVMEVKLPVMDGIEATKEITSKFPYIKVLALSIHFNRSTVMAMFKAGASGYVLKNCSFDNLVYAIKTVIEDEFPYLSPQIVGLIVDSYVDRRKLKNNKLAYPVLSERESQVLRFLAEGKSLKEIALEIRMSTKTVDACRRQLMNKLKIDNLAGLVKYAIREGLASL